MLYKEFFVDFRHFITTLKGPSQPPPSKLSLISHGEVKSECFTIGCVPEKFV